MITLNEHIEVLLALVLICLALVYLFRRSKALPLPLPPGPAKGFLIGNMRHLVRQHEWLACAKMGQDRNRMCTFNATLRLF